MPAAHDWQGQTVPKRLDPRGLFLSQLAGPGRAAVVVVTAPTHATANDANITAESNKSMTGLKARLSNAHPAVFTLFAGLAGFSAYFSMYAFRKPFSAATFDNVEGWTFLLDYKVALVIAQVAGYALSKLIGVKVVSEIGSGRRGLAILALIGVAWLALLVFP